MVPRRSYRRFQLLGALILAVGCGDASSGAPEEGPAPAIPLEREARAAVESDGGTPENPVDPTGKAYELPTSVTPVFMASRLDWRFDEARPDFAKAVANLAKECSTRRTVFLGTNKVVPIIDVEGRGASDPVAIGMEPVRAGLSQMSNVAYCAYFADTKEERAASRKAIVDYIASWAATYVGDGNPINDSDLTALIVAADLLLPKMTEAEIAPLFKMLRTMDAKGATWLSSIPATNPAGKNFFHIRSRSIRALANVVVGDPAPVQSARTALNAAIADYFTAPAEFKLSKCANLKAIDSYGSRDLQERDSFKFHTYALADVLPFLRLEPGFLDASSITKIEAALNVTKPYVLAEKSHPEFICTTSQYDKDQVAANPMLTAPWDPDTARVGYRHARVALPSTVPWTARFLTSQYSLWLKVYLAGKGDVVQ